MSRLLFNDIKTITVKELIEMLKQLSQNLPVLTSGYEGGFEKIHKPSVIKVKHKPNNPNWDGEFQDVDDKVNDAIEVVAIQRVYRL